MFLKKILTIIAWGMMACSSLAQDYKGEFDRLYDKDDPTKQFKLLQKWAEEKPKDPELFTSYFNYYFQKARQEYLSLSNEAPQEQSFQLQNSDGEATGYIHSKIEYDLAIVQKGIRKINEGIAMYPNRLDMRFGKIYVYGQLKDWEHFTEEIIVAIHYSQKNKNAWTWTYGEKILDGQEFFLSSIQDYQLDLYETQNDDLLKYMRKIALAVLEIYPDNIESLSNLSISYILTGKFDLAIEALHKALELAPEDAIVMSNLAHAYQLKGDLHSSISYYERLLSLDDSDAQNLAKQQLSLLREAVKK